MTIIPAIDILDGKCVRLTKGDYSTGVIYSEDPLETALMFENAGISRLHLVDLDGAGGNHIINRKVLSNICHNTNLTVDFGGGIKTDSDIDSAFDSGAAMVTVGSAAANNPDMVHRWITKYGVDKIILGADVRGESIAVNGWKEDSGINLFDFIKEYTRHGIYRIICTDIKLDGTLQGPSTALYSAIQRRFPQIRLTASGGVSSVKDLLDLRELGVDSAIVGKAYYEGRISLNDIARFNENDK